MTGWGAVRDGQLRIQSGEEPGSALLTIDDTRAILDRDTVVRLAEVLMDIAGVASIIRPVRIVRRKPDVTLGPPDPG